MGAPYVAGCRSVSDAGWRQMAVYCRLEVKNVLLPGGSRAFACGGVGGWVDI